MEEKKEEEIDEKEKKAIATYGALVLIQVFFIIAGFLFLVIKFLGPYM